MATSHTPRSTGRPACRVFSADTRLVTSRRVLGPQLSLQRGGREPGAAWVAPALAARRRQHADALRSPHAASLLRRLDSVAPPPQGSARCDRSGGRLGRSVARRAGAAGGRGVRVPRCAVECAAPGAAFPAATAAADGTLPSLCISPGLRSRCRRLCSGGPLRPEGLWAGGHAERRTTQGQGRCGRWCLLVGASAGGLGGVQPRSLRVLRPVASGRGGPSAGRPRRGLAWNGRARGRGCVPRHAGCGGYGGVLSYVHAAAGPHRPGRSARRATGAQACGPKLSVC